MLLSLPYKEYSHLREHLREIHSAVCCAWFWVYRTKNTPTYANTHGKFTQQWAVHGFGSTVQRILPLTRTLTGNSFSSELCMVLGLPYKEYSHLRELSREIHSALCCTWFWVYRTKNTPNYANIHGKFIQQYAVHDFESTAQRIFPLTRTFKGNSFSSKLYMLLSLPYKEYSHLREHSREIHSAVLLYMVLSLPYKEYSHLREHSREIHSAVSCTWF